MVTSTICAPTPDAVCRNLNMLRAVGQRPALCVVENDSARRNHILSVVAAHAAGQGIEVILAHQSPHDTFSAPTLPEYVALTAALNAMRADTDDQGTAQTRTLFILPRLELPMDAALHILAGTSPRRHVAVVVGAATAACGPALDFSPGWYPCDFPLLWLDGAWRGRCSAHVAAMAG